MLLTILLVVKSSSEMYGLILWGFLPSMDGMASTACLGLMIVNYCSLMQVIIESCQSAVLVVPAILA